VLINVSLLTKKEDSKGLMMVKLMIIKSRRVNVKVKAISWNCNYIVIVFKGRGGAK